MTINIFFYINIFIVLYKLPNKRILLNEAAGVLPIQREKKNPEGE